MRVCIAALLSLTPAGLVAGIIIILAHGASSAGIFAGAGALYTASGSRALFLNKGALIFAPIIVALWFGLNMGIAAAPPTVNLLGEIIAFITIFGYFAPLVVAMALIVFLGLAYALMLYSAPAQGKTRVYSDYILPSAPAFTQSLALLVLAVIGGGTLWA